MPSGEQDRACPKCGALSEYVAPETVDIGVGFQAIEPPSWICPEHGHWCYGDDGKLVIEEDGPATATTLREAMRSALAPAREAHDRHVELDPGCPFCTGAIT